MAVFADEILRIPGATVVRDDSDPLKKYHEVDWFVSYIDHVDDDGYWIKSISNGVLAVCSPSDKASRVEIPFDDVHRRSADRITYDFVMKDVLVARVTFTKGEWNYFNEYEADPEWVQFGSAERRFRIGEADEQLLIFANADMEIGEPENSDDEQEVECDDVDA
jgi:hypothetical protein